MLKEKCVCLGKSYGRRYSMMKILLFERVAE
jgi:hypothetical protein